MTPSFDFAVSLWEKYQPKTLGDFVGLERPKAIFGAFVKKPFASAWLLVGPSGTGKTTMGLVLAETLKAELHHVASRACDLETVEGLAHLCQYIPLSGGFHLILVDEADQMTAAAQLAFLSKLDATAFPPNTIFVFTANATDRFEQRFLSRLRRVEFGTADVTTGLPPRLKYIWGRETGRLSEIDLDGICASAEGNVRDALIRLEVEIMAAPAPKAPAARHRSAVAAKRVAAVAAKAPVQINAPFGWTGGLL